MRFAPLLGVLVGVGLIAAGLACLYLVMRAVGLENGGTCVSGGPYEIAPGHECQDGVFALGFGGAFSLIVGFLILLWGSHRHGGPLVVTSMSGFSWSAFMGGLGGSFLSIASEMPGPSDTISEFNTVGAVFAVMGAVGLAVAFGPILYSLQGRPLNYPKPSLLAWAAWLAAAGAGLGLAALAFGGNILE